jgi:hypothetical protein
VALLVPLLAIGFLLHFRVAAGGGEGHNGRRPTVDREGGEEEEDHHHDHHHHRQGSGSWGYLQVGRIAERTQKTGMKEEIYNCVPFVLLLRNPLTRERAAWGDPSPGGNGNVTADDAACPVMSQVLGLGLGLGLGGGGQPTGRVRARGNSTSSSCTTSTEELLDLDLDDGNTAPMMRAKRTATHDAAGLQNASKAGGKVRRRAGSL